jgi:hypothetical protein
MKLVNRRSVLGGGLLLTSALAANATGEPVSGNTALDATIVLLAAAIVAIGVFSGGGGAIKAGIAVFNKVMKYFNKSV